MSINALYMAPYPADDTTTSKLRLTVKMSGIQNIFSALMLVQFVTASLPPITTTSNYMTIYHGGTNDGVGSGIFLKYTGGKYYLGVRYIVKNGTTWNEVPGSFVDLSLYSSNLNADAFMLMLSYDITSRTAPNITFSLVNFSTSTPKTAPDFNLDYTFSSTEISATGQWGFGCVPQTNVNQYGLILTNNYNSYVSAGTYLTYLQGWTTYINSSTTGTTYGMFNTNNSAYSIYSIMRGNSFINPTVPGSLVFQLNVPNTTLSNVRNQLDTNTLVSLNNAVTTASLPGFTINGSDTGTTYITSVQNAITCLLKGTKMLTENGYKLIQHLTLEDKLITHNNRIINIKKINVTYAKPNEETIPLIIRKGQYGAIEDLYISKGHLVKVGNKFILPDKLNLEKMENYFEPFEYYHIETDNYLEDTMIANGVVVETKGDTEENWKILSNKIFEN